MPDITCPVCGEVNPADQEFCQYCQSRLQPPADDLKSENAPITPGQFPTKKVTAELEPILPQWLRDARDKARKAAEEQAAKEPVTQPSVSPADLLAGLQSQKEEEEEETPDWLAHITGQKPKPKKADTGPMEVHWVELGKPDEFLPDEEKKIAATQEPTESAGAEELPAWLAGIEPTESGVDELSQWLREANSQREDLPAAKRATVPPSGPAAEPEAVTPSDEESSDWLRSLQEEQPAQLSDVPQAEALQPQEMPDSDWLKNLQDQHVESTLESGDQPEQISTELPSWLKADTAATGPGSADIPEWLKSSAPTPQEPTSADIPDWLKAAAPQSSVFSEEPGQKIPPSTETPEWLTSLQGDETRESSAAAAVSSETPDWLAALQKESAGQALQPETPETGTQLPAFVDEALADLDASSLFTELPDWLANAAAEQPEAAAISPATTPVSTEPLEPGELPSWVQAMRPIEASQLPSSAAGEQTLETHGALAGLQGVLPAVPMAGATSKPRAYSVMLQATEEQLAHSALLEQILSAETAPEPIASFAPLATQRLLRWALGLLLLITVGGGLLLRTQLFSLPVYAPESIPPEVRDALAVLNVVADGAPVLIVMEYEPALAGEMEAAALPLLNGLVSKRAVLTFVSTSPTGGLLAEHLFAGPLRDTGYIRGTDYRNLGYLPGGLTGVRSFAQNPEAAVPIDLDRNPLPLQGITSLAYYPAMIVITDNAESARIWVEQAGGLIPMVMVSSAQAAPMIEPYYNARQINGVVSGLYGGAVFGQNYAGGPGHARSYWDVFSLSLLMAVFLIVAGGLWSLAGGLRERAMAEGRL